jgi:hypothetical protein
MKNLIPGITLLAIVADTKVMKASKEKIAKLKTKKQQENKVDKANTTALVKKITDKKNLVYKYPEDCDTIEKRKAFRTKARKTLTKLEKNLNLAKKGKLEGITEAKVEKELTTFKKANYLSAKDY